jgi:hypothetical protein
MPRCTLIATKSAEIRVAQVERSAYARRQPRMPNQPIAVPSTSDTAVSARCTPKKAVIPSCQDRGSAQMFFRKVGQMIQDQTPKAMRNHETRLEMSTRPVSPSL